MDPAFVYLGMALVFGLFMAWGIGANDVANAMATSVGSRAITVKQAILIAAIFEFLGAFLAGGEVTATIRKGIIDSSMITDPTVLLHGMLASLLAAGVWLTIASRYGWPVSTTHSIVGALVGFALVAVGVDAVYLDKVGFIAASWVVSPVIAGTMAFVLIVSVQKLIFDKDDPERSARLYVPAYIFLTALVIGLVTALKGLSHVGMNINGLQAFAYSLVFASVVAGMGVLMIRRVKLATSTEVADFHFANVERIFNVLMIVTACAMAFAHGSNDVANAIGPVAAVVSIVDTGEIAQRSPIPIYVLLLGAVGIVVGLATYGYKVIRTVGSRITELTPSRGFAATLAAASTVVLASGTGLPISTTHTLVGAVLGVGLARGISALNLGVIRTIFMSWVITLPVGASLSVIFYFLLHFLMGSGEWMSEGMKKVMSEEEQLKRYSFSVWSYKQGEMVSLMIHIGDRLGLYKALNGAGPVSASELAEKTSLKERWLLEWLRGQAAARLLDYHDPDRFELTSIGAAVLADEESSLAFAAGAFAGQTPPATVDKIVEAFSTGVGLSYEELGPNAAHRTERMLGPWTRQELVPKIIPALDGVVAKLEAGAVAADIGCGGGVALMAMAQAFPASEFHGYDPSAHAIKRCEEKVAELGLSNVKLFVAGGESVPVEPTYDFLITFDCLHDMTRPADVIGSIKGAMKADGTWLIKDIRSQPDFKENLRNPLLAMFYGFSVSACMSSALSEPGGAGLGTLGFNPEVAEAMIKAAGFSRFHQHDFEDPSNLYYEVRP